MFAVRRAFDATQRLLPFLTAIKINLVYVGVTGVPHTYKQLPSCKLVMMMKQPALILMFMSCLVISGWAPAFCMDLTIAPSAMASNATKVSRVREVRQRSLKNERQKGISALAEKVPRHQKFRKSRITSYSLSGGPIFTDTSVGTKGERKFGLTTGIKGFGSPWGDDVSPMPLVVPHTPFNTVPSSKQEPVNNAGIAFDCGKKSRLTSLEVTACYVHKVDKAWKTQTYVTKGLVDSNSGWGGGLSIGYVY